MKMHGWYERIHTQVRKVDIFFTQMYNKLDITAAESFHHTIETNKRSDCTILLRVKEIQAPRSRVISWVTKLWHAPRRDICLCARPDLSLLWSLLGVPSLLLELVKEHMFSGPWSRVSLSASPSSNLNVLHSQQTCPLPFSLISYVSK